MIKCGICSNVYLPLAHHYHCPNCNAIAVRINGVEKFFNVGNGKEIVRGDTSWTSRLVEIARMSMREMNLERTV